MPFPSTAATTPSLEEALKQVTSLAGAIKQRTVALSNTSAAGPVDGAALINYLRDLVAAKTRLADRVNTPGLPGYAKGQYNDLIMDISAEYVSMVKEINATIAWLQANFPKDANGYLLYEQMAAGGAVTYRSFTSAQLAPFRAQLNLLAATIA